jgi:hypothetical protein
MSEPKQITELWAWVVTEADGGEGVPAIELDGVALPLVGADGERMKLLRPYAEQVAGRGVPVKLMRFSGAEVVETLGPKVGH